MWTVQENKKHARAHTRTHTYTQDELRLLVLPRNCSVTFPDAKKGVLRIAFNWHLWHHSQHPVFVNTQVTTALPPSLLCAKSRLTTQHWRVFRWLEDTKWIFSRGIHFELLAMNGSGCLVQDSTFHCNLSQNILGGSMLIGCCWKSRVHCRGQGCNSKAKMGGSQVVGWKCTERSIGR